MLKVGCIGCGQLGREHARRLQNKISDCEVVAICDVNEEAAKALAEELGVKKVYTDYAELINDPEVEAVECTTPSAFHTAPVLEAIRLEKPIFIEKPLTPTAEESKQIVDAEMATGKHLVQVGFNRRFDLAYDQVKELLDSGDFGAPLIVRSSSRASGIAIDYPYYSTELQITDAATHAIDLLPYLINEDMDEVEVFSSKSTRHVKPELQDPITMMMKSKEGTICFIEEFHDTGYIGYHITTEVVCEDGMIELPQPIKPIVHKDNVKGTALDRSWQLRWAETYDAQFEDWVKNAKVGSTKGASAWDGYMAAVIGDAFLESLEKGGTAKVKADPRPDFYKR